MKLTQTQARCLLMKHLTGDFPSRRWETVKALLNKGMLEEKDGRLVVTEQGRQYCDDNHLDIRI